MPLSIFVVLNCYPFDCLPIIRSLMDLISLTCSCKEPVEPLTIDEIADRCHAPEEVLLPFLASLLKISCSYHEMGSSILSF